MKRPWIVAAVMALLQIDTGSATAQDAAHARRSELADVHLRNDCRLAAQVLTGGQPANKREWALDTIDRCDESGPPVLARMWREVAADSASLGRMIYGSVYMRDRRVYEVASAIALDRSVPALKRAAALHLLGRWAQPGFSLHFRQFFAPGFESAERNGVIHRTVSDDVQYEGAEPLPAAIRTDVQRLAADLAATDPDFRLRAAAKLLASALLQ